MSIGSGTFISQSELDLCWGWGHTTMPLYACGSQKTTWSTRPNLLPGLRQSLFWSLLLCTPGKVTWPSRNDSCSTFSLNIGAALGSWACAAIPSFMWVLRTRTQDLMHGWQVLCPLNPCLLLSNHVTFLGNSPLSLKFLIYKTGWVVRMMWSTPHADPPKHTAWYKFPHPGHHYYPFSKSLCIHMWWGHWPQWL